MKVKSLSLEYILPEEYNSKLYSINVTPSEEEAITADILNGKYDNEVLDVVIKLELERTVNGIPVTSNGTSCYIDDAMFGAQWGYESFSISLCKEGIYSVAWRSPHRIIETITDDSSVRSFEEITEIFNNMYRVTNDEMTQNCNIAGEVTRVTLTLRRVMEQNNIGYGLFVPVWDFYGMMTISELDYADEPPMQMFSEDESILTINAVDGSVIDLDKGY